MNDYFDPTHKQRLSEARESFSGRLLTDSQFDEAIAITGIIEVEIYKTGTFREKLADYAYAFARTEKFDVVKAEATLRDLFKANTGQTMNQLRETLMEREDRIEEGDSGERAEDLAKQATRAVHAMIKDGDKISFHRAYDTKAGEMAAQMGITIAGAKRIMGEVFRREADGSLYDWGKEIEDKYYRPQIEAEKAERARSDLSILNNTKRNGSAGSSESSGSRRPRRSRARQPV